MKRFEAALLLALSFTLCFGLRTAAQQERLREKVIRLHVVAQSDSEEHQAEKIRVRDSVLEYLDKVELPDGLENEFTAISNAAQSASGGKIAVSLGREAFPARIGDGYTLPAGEYETLRITIGDGAGHNWWGIIFPQFTGGTQEEISAAADILGKENLRLISGGEEKYEIRFKVIEMIEQMRSRFFWGEKHNIPAGASPRPA